jgi:hypothetical protein
MMKNVCESLLDTPLNMPKRIKDEPKVRNDLIELNIRKELHAGHTQNDLEDTSGHKGKKVMRNYYYCPLPTSL